MDIVRDGLVLVGNGGKLLLTDSRDFALTGSGYGSGSERVLASPSSSPFSSSSTNLPPLPPIASSVEDVRFTWIANKLVMYFPLHICVYIYIHKNVYIIIYVHRKMCIPTYIVFYIALTLY